MVSIQHEVGNNLKTSLTSWFPFAMKLVTIIHRSKRKLYGWNVNTMTHWSNNEWHAVFDVLTKNCCWGVQSTRKEFLSRKINAISSPPITTSFLWRHSLKFPHDWDRITLSPHEMRLENDPHIIYFRSILDIYPSK